jgi:hypothetical protein
MESDDNMPFVAVWYEGISFVCFNPRSSGFRAFEKRQSYRSYVDYGKSVDND